MVYIRIHIYIDYKLGPYPSSRYADPPPLRLKKVPFLIFHAQCYETNEKSILRFLVLRYGRSKF